MPVIETSMCFREALRVVLRLLIASGLVDAAAAENLEQSYGLASSHQIGNDLAKRADPRYSWCTVAHNVWLSRECADDVENRIWKEYCWEPDDAFLIRGVREGLPPHPPLAEAAMPDRAWLARLTRETYARLNAHHLPREQVEAAGEEILRQFGQRIEWRFACPRQHVCLQAVDEDRDLHIVCMKVKTPQEMQDEGPEYREPGQWPEVYELIDLQNLDDGDVSSIPPGRVRRSYHMSGKGRQASFAAMLSELVHDQTLSDSFGMESESGRTVSHVVP